jgi:hypothetical protein
MQPTREDGAQAAAGQCYMAFNESMHPHSPVALLLYCIPVPLYLQINDRYEFYEELDLDRENRHYFAAEVSLVGSDCTTKSANMNAADVLAGTCNCVRKCAL